MEIHIQSDQTPIINQSTNTNAGIVTKNARIYTRRMSRLEIYVESLAKMMHEISEDGWSLDLLTIMPKKVSRDKRLISPLVHVPVTRTYSRLVTRVVRRPRSTFGLERKPLPVLVGAADLPFPKRRIGGVGIDPNVDGGLHFHGLLALPPRSRLGDQSARDHFAKNDQLYRRGGGIERIDVQPVHPSDASRVMRYCLKAICRRALDLDEAILILPRVNSELDEYNTSGIRISNL